MIDKTVERWDALGVLEVHDAVQLWLLKRIVADFVQFVLIEHGEYELNKIMRAHGLQAITDKDELEVIRWERIGEENNENGGSYED